MAPRMSFKAPSPSASRRARFSSAKGASAAGRALVLAARRARIPLPIVTTMSAGGAAGEWKNTDTSQANLAIPNTGIIQNPSLINMATGPSPNTRIGRRIQVRQFGIRGYLVLNGDDTPTESWDTVRMILYIDRQSNGATAAVTDILETASVNSFNNLGNSQRFTIVLDQQVRLNTGAALYDGAAQAWGRAVKEFSFHRKLNFPVEYSGNAGDITDLRSNNISLLLISANARCNAWYTVRMRYTDQ